MQDAIGAIQSGVNGLLDRQSAEVENIRELIEASGSVVRDAENVSAGMRDAARATQDSLAEFATLTTQMRASGETLKAGSEQLTSVVGEFVEQSGEFLSANRETVNEIQNALGVAQRTVTDYSQRFEVIEEGLKSIFDKLQEGLVAYDSAVAGSVRSHLANFAEQFAKAATAVASIVEPLGEIAEDILEKRDKVTRS